MDIIKTIKRLELIQNLISLEEDDEINSHILKLKSLNGSDEIKNIIDLLEKKKYSNANISITAFINQHRQVSSYIDPEIAGLKLEAKTLEAEVNNLSNEKADLEKLIHEFGIRHNHELGELILKILEHKKAKAKGTPKQEETERDYDDFNKEYEILKDEVLLELTKEEKKELKQKYRRASKLCHPDVVSEEQKELADKLFIELNKAYEMNDLKRVTELLENLTKGEFFFSKSDIINEKQKLKSEIENLRLKIKKILSELINIKESESYKTIQNINDWDSYFAETKSQLHLQLNYLEDVRE